jgi:hypothetical protein
MKMPTISMFYEIVVLMYYRDIVQHHLPHIHVRYQGEEVVINIENGETLTGKIPNSTFRL